MDIPSDNRTVLLTLGRLPVALELARALHDGGWRVVVAEPFAWHICRLSTSVDKSFTVTAPTVDNNAYLSELEAIISAEQISLVLPVSEETLFVSALHGRLDESVRLLCIAHEPLMQLHDKFCFTQLAGQHELPVPPTALASDADASRAVTAASYVVKPRLSCSGAGVRFGLAGTNLEAHETSDRYVVQQHLFGSSCSSFSIAAEGRVLTSVCYRSLIQSGSVSVCFEPMDMPEDIGVLIEKIVSSCVYSGMISFDFIQDQQGAWRAIECNPRATSGLHFIKPADIVKTLVNSDSVEYNPFPVKRLEFWSCLMQVEGALFKGRIDRSGWRNLFAAKDITWRWSDMKPFLYMSFVLAPQLYKAFRKRRPVSEILMTDVGWHDSAR